MDGMAGGLSIGVSEMTHDIRRACVERRRGQKAGSREGGSASPHRADRRCRKAPVRWRGLHELRSSSMLDYIFAPPARPATLFGPNPEERSVCVCVRASSIAIKDRSRTTRHAHGNAAWRPSIETTGLTLLCRRRPLLHFLPRRPCVRCRPVRRPAARDRSLSTGSPYHGHPSTFDLRA
jgi:hypothetical protein